MRKAKLTFILTLAILGPMVWMLGLSDAGNALLKSYGVFGCTIQALGISTFSAWLIVSFAEEITSL